MVSERDVGHGSNSEFKDITQHMWGKGWDLSVIFGKK